MQDRFRVRVWDIERKKYVYDAQFEPDYDVIENDKKYIPEQCTGIRDYLGTLIYEGDIIKNLRTKNSYYKVVVETNNYSFKFVGDNDSERISYFEKYAVIGNIHENPELLEEDKWQWLKLTIHIV